jgi:hypothetical protein
VRGPLRGGRVFGLRLEEAREALLGPHREALAAQAAALLAQLEPPPLDS